VLGMQSGVNSVSMAVGVMQKALYSSYTARILDAMDRRTDARRMRDIIGLLKRHGIRAGTFIMLGYLGET